MIKFIQKLVILWEKKKLLTLLEMEQGFLEKMYFPIISRDSTDLRNRLGYLNAKKDRKKQDEKEVIELNTKINETEKYKNMIEQGKTKAGELRVQIHMFKKNLWS
jgi:hypothetical protein